jgi:hypothetical protein
VTACHGRSAPVFELASAAAESANSAYDRARRRGPEAPTQHREHDLAWCRDPQLVIVDVRQFVRAAQTSASIAKVLPSGSRNQAIRPPPARGVMALASCSNSS